MSCANDVSRHDVYVEKAIAAMRRDPAKRWTVAALARVAGLSRAPFARRFREATGMAPLRWLIGLRVSLAQSLLLDEEVSLAMVAVELGYSSEFAFSKAFKRVVGVPPGQFRRVVLLRREPTVRPLVRAAA